MSSIRRLTGDPASRWRRTSRESPAIAIEPLTDLTTRSGGRCVWDLEDLSDGRGYAWSSRRQG
jgi:hypothetical protein